MHLDIIFYIYNNFHKSTNAMRDKFLLFYIPFVLYENYNVQILLNIRNK